MIDFLFKSPSESQVFVASAQEDNVIAVFLDDLGPGEEMSVVSLRSADHDLVMRRNVEFQPWRGRVRQLQTKMSSLPLC